jgi:hypothetical protein
MASRHQLGHASLVHRVEVRVEQADGHGLHAVGARPAITRRAAASSSGRSTLPSGNSRSSTSRRRWRGTSGAGGSMSRSYMS